MCWGHWTGDWETKKLAHFVIELCEKAHDRVKKEETALLREILCQYMKSVTLRVITSQAWKDLNNEKLEQIQNALKTKMSPVRKEEFLQDETLPEWKKLTIYLDKDYNPEYKPFIQGHPEQLNFGPLPSSTAPETTVLVLYDASRQITGSGQDFPTFLSLSSPATTALVPHDASHQTTSSGQGFLTLPSLPSPAITFLIPHNASHRTTGSGQDFASLPPSPSPATTALVSHDASLQKSGKGGRNSGRKSGQKKSLQDRLRSLIGRYMAT